MSKEITVEIQTSRAYSSSVNMETVKYDNVTNKPKINGVELVGDKSTKDLKIEVDTTKFATKEEVAGKADKSDIPTVPTKVSEFENDSGFTTAEDLAQGLELKQDKGDYATNARVNQIAASIPDAYDDTEIRILIDEVEETSENAKAIAEGKATGYVFDTVEDMNAWLESNSSILKLGDNLYIRAVNVPDYWWDGETVQQLETQKVDLTDYVKNTDYATTAKAGVVKSSSNYGFFVNETNGIPYAGSKGLAGYQSADKNSFIGKATLENIKNDLVKRAVTENDITLTDDEKTAAQAWLGVSGGGLQAVSHDNTLSGAGTDESPLGLSEAIKDEISNKLDKEYASDFRGEWSNYASVPSDSNAYPADTLGSHIPNYNDYIVVKDSSDYFVASSKNLLETDVVGATINSTPTAKFIVNYDVWYLGVAYNGYMGSNVPLDTFHSGVGTISFISNSADSYGVCRFVRLKPNTTYTISAKNGGRCAIASLTDEGGGYSKFSTHIQTPTSLPITFTTNDNSTYGIVLYANSQGTECTFEEIQLEIGSVATSYEVSGGYYLEGTWRFRYSGDWAQNGKLGWTPEYKLNESVSNTAVVDLTDDTVELATNTIYNAGEMSSLTITLPTTDAMFTSQLNFTSGATATAFTAPDTIKWAGDDITDNAFVPAANKRYSVMFYSDNVNIRAIVQGVE